MFNMDYHFLNDLLYAWMAALCKCENFWIKLNISAYYLMRCFDYILTQNCFMLF